MQIQKYVAYFCDPVDQNRLELRYNKNRSQYYLKNPSTGVCYREREGILDLRPESGYLGPETADPLGGTPVEDPVLAHYDKKPCHNYLDLNNVPTGRWLREQKYDQWFTELDFAVEVGCGKGAILDAFKRERNMDILGIDLAPGSIQHIAKPPLGADGILGSTLAIPIKDGVADFVISHAVIHHTPDPIGAFSEVVRILKPGGLLLFNTYNWHNPFRSWYFFFSPPLKLVRKLLGSRFGDFLIRYTAFLGYYLILWSVLGVRQKQYRPPSFSIACEQFFDFFLTPYARFYTKEEIVSLARVHGLEILEHDTGGWPQNSQSHFCMFRKK